MSGGWPSAQHAIRSNNRVWRLFYYDDLVDTADYQLSYFALADAGFYNCAQAVSRWDESVRTKVESYFSERGLQPAIYVDPESPCGLADELALRGYRLQPSEQEHWHGLAIDPASYEHADSSIHLVDSGDADSLDAFVELDAEVNGLPAPAAAKLRANLASRRDPDIAVCHLLTRVDGVPACCGSVAVVDGLAFLAEGATALSYRRQGLYRRLTRARLRFAADRGARFAFFTAAHDALSNLAGPSIEFSLRFRRDYWRLPAVATMP